MPAVTVMPPSEKAVHAGAVHASTHEDNSVRGAPDERITINEEKNNLFLKTNVVLQPHTAKIYILTSS